MRDIPATALGGVAVLFAGVALIVIGPPRHVPPPPVPSSDTVFEPAQINAGGVALVSTGIDLPGDDAAYPEGPHADVINANCTSCHSASMALTQPELSKDQWKAIVAKMRDTYKAPVPETAVPDIVAYLTTMSSKLPAGPPSSSPGSADRSGGDRLIGPGGRAEGSTHEVPLSLPDRT